MDTVLALSSKKKADRLSRRIKRKVNSVDTPDALVAHLDQEEGPTLLIVDASLPSLSGKNLLEQLRQKGRNVQLVLVSDLAAYDASKLLSVISPSEEIITERNQREKWTHRAKLRTKLHNPKTGRIHAGHVAEFFGISLSKLARVLDCSPQSIHKTPDSARKQKKLGAFFRIATALTKLFETPENARLWLNTPHPELDNFSPLEIIEKRKVEIVADMLEDSLLGHPS